jgi:hypothetical protein
MASKRGERRRRCESKQRYADREEALHAAIAANRREKSVWIVPYACHFCGGWHIGHAPKSAMDSMRERGVR